MSTTRTEQSTGTEEILVRNYIAKYNRAARELMNHMELEISYEELDASRDRPMRTEQDAKEAIDWHFHHVGEASGGMAAVLIEVAQRGYKA